MLATEPQSNVAQACRKALNIVEQHIFARMFWDRGILGDEAKLHWQRVTLLEKVSPPKWPGDCDPPEENWIMIGASGIQL